MSSPSVSDPSMPIAARSRLCEAAGSAASGLVARLRRPVASGSYAAEIDGLRFIAIAIVVVGHFMERAVRFFPVARAEMADSSFAALVQRPGLGVYLFFAISGFIITRQVIKARASPLSGAFLKSYFGRRILRIEPPYVILLVVTWLLLTVSGYQPDHTNHFEASPSSLGLSLLGSIFYLHDLVWGTYPRLFPPGWSLEIEVQFYVLAPLLFWLFVKARSVAMRVALGLCGLVLGALASLTAPGQIGPVHTSVSILQFFHYFWLGILLAHLHGWIVERTAGLSPHFTGALGWCGLVAYLVMPNAPVDDLAVAMTIRAATIAAVVAIFVSAFALGSSFRAFCRRPWISLLGGACYSIYLTHLQVIQAMTSVFGKLTSDAGTGLVSMYLIVDIVVVAMVGMVFYALIERTFMNKDWPHRARAVARTLVLRLSDRIGGPQTVAGRSASPWERR